MDNNKIYRLNNYLIIIFLIYVTFKFVLIPYLDQIFDDEDLGSHFWYFTPSDAIDVGLTEDDARLYKSVESGNYSNTIIYPTVVDVRFDDDFILAIQRNRKNNGLNYFIIDKTINSLFGPYNIHDFNQMRKKFNISKELTFDSSYMKN